MPLQSRFTGMNSGMGSGMNPGHSQNLRSFFREGEGDGVPEGPDDADEGGESAQQQRQGQPVSTLWPDGQVLSGRLLVLGDSRRRSVGQRLLSSDEISDYGAEGLHDGMCY